jgi:hypothetical protein
MQLSDVLEKYTIKELSYHSKISENNLDKIFAKDFESLQKIHTLGYISIIEREYKADLSDLRTEAIHYYAQCTPEGSKRVALSNEDRYKKEEKSRGFSIIIILLLGYASWYFLTQFDKKHLSELVPFIAEETIEKFVSSYEKNTSVEATVDTAKTVEQEGMKKEAIETKVEMISPSKELLVKKAEAIAEPIVEKVESNTTIENNITKQSEATPTDTISIVPDNRLWFGLINTTSKKRDHFSVADAYLLDVSTTTWLVATSSASFSLKTKKKTTTFKDNQDHYFSIDKEGAKSLSKSEYVALGGWEQW